MNIVLVLGGKHSVARALSFVVKLNKNFIVGIKCKRVIERSIATYGLCNKTFVFPVRTCAHKEHFSNSESLPATAGICI